LAKAENLKKLQLMVVKGTKIDLLKVEPMIPALILGYEESERL